MIVWRFIVWWLPDEDPPDDDDDDDEDEDGVLEFTVVGVVLVVMAIREEAEEG